MRMGERGLESGLAQSLVSAKSGPERRLFNFAARYAKTDPSMRARSQVGKFGKH